MDQRAVIRLFALKGLIAKVIQAELDSVYDAKKWGLRFVRWRTILCNDPRSGRPLTNNLAEAVRCGLWWRKSRSHRAGFCVGIVGL
jgi:hypothetical protein